MKKFIRTASAITAVCLATLFFSSCGSNVEDTETAEQFVMWSGDAHSKTVMTGLVNEFNNTVGRKNNFKLTYEVHEGDMKQKVELAMTTDQAPDFFPGAVTSFAQNKQIVPIDDMPGGKEFIAEYDGNLVEGWHTYEGKTYTVPYSVTTMGLIYNKDMFKEAGLVDEKGEAKPPKTVGEIRECAKALTNQMKKQYGIVFPLKWKSWFDFEISRSVMASVGNVGYNPKTGNYDYSAFEPIMQCVMDMKKDGSIYPGAESIDNDIARARFAEGNIGMKISYSWDVGVFTNQFPAKCDWGVAPIPVYDESKVYLQAAQPGWAPFITKKAYDTKDHDKLMMIYKWYNSDEMLKTLYSEGLQIPWNSSCIEGVKLKNDARGWKEFGDLLSISRIIPYPIKTDTTGEKTLAEMFVDNVWNQGETIDTVLDKWTSVSNDGIAKYKQTHPEYDGSDRIDASWNPVR